MRIDINFAKTSTLNFNSFFSWSLTPLQKKVAIIVFAIFYAAFFYFSYLSKSGKQKQKISPIPRQKQEKDYQVSRDLEISSLSPKERIESQIRAKLVYLPKFEDNEIIPKFLKAVPDNHFFIRRSTTDSTKYSLNYKVSERKWERISFDVDSEGGICVYHPDHYEGVYLNLENLFTYVQLNPKAQLNSFASHQLLFDICKESLNEKIWKGEIDSTYYIEVLKNFPREILLFSLPSKDQMPQYKILYYIDDSLREDEGIHETFFEMMSTGQLNVIDSTYKDNLKNTKFNDLVSLSTSFSLKGLINKDAYLKVQKKLTNAG